MKDYKAILEKYRFRDALGYPLETCQDYLDLLAELARMHAALDQATDAMVGACTECWPKQVEAYNVAQEALRQLETEAA